MTELLVYPQKKKYVYVIMTDFDTLSMLCIVV